MKKIYFLLLVVLIAYNHAVSQSNTGKNNSGVTQSTSVATPDTAQSNLGFLKDLDGKSLYETKLLDNPIFKKRLIHLIGNRYDFLKNLAVESPITVNNKIFVARKCQAHNCGSTNIIIVVDISKNIMYVGIREENQVKTYSEDGSSSQEITDWAKKI